MTESERELHWAMYNTQRARMWYPIRIPIYLKTLGDLQDIAKKNGCIVVAPDDVRKVKGRNEPITDG